MAFLLPISRNALGLHVAVQYVSILSFYNFLAVRLSTLHDLQVIGAVSMFADVNGVGVMAREIFALLDKDL